MSEPLRTPEHPWALDADAVVEALATSRDDGLTDAEAAARLERFGPNRLREVGRRSAWAMLRDQFASLIVGLLVVASVVAFATGDDVEGVAILAVIVVNVAIGFTTERRATRSMEALRRLGHVDATVRRGGVARTLPAEQLVPGDVILLDAGDVLTADARILESSRLGVDESPLTGESLPVDKGVDAVPGEAHLAERSSMLFKGTAVADGTAEAVVVATGMDTELGHISSLVASAESEATPLEERLDALGRRLVRLTLAIAVVIAAAFVVSGREFTLALDMAIALAVATIPEGLPIVATVALARGMWRMAKRNALVEQLTAVETLGSTTVILTDKTGTLTENRMTVVELRLGERVIHVGGTGLELDGAFRDGEAEIDPTADDELLDALRVGALCNNATLSGEGRDVSSTGDPTEVALLVVGAKAGLRADALDETWPSVGQVAFDPETKRMATLHAGDAGREAAVKGAPELLIAACARVRDGDGSQPLDDERRAAWLGRADEMAAEGQRVLAVARGPVSSPESYDFDDLELLGLVGFFDPPRETVRDAIAQCRAAGIRMVMVTGDHAATGWTIAKAVGLVDEQADVATGALDAREFPSFTGLDADTERRLLATHVFARATPAQKLELIELHQRHGGVVAMTGDGVNDAPALKRADIGVAMGVRGTQVAREAAKMVLQDDELGSIVAAVAQGRAIFANIRKFVVYLLSCNVSEIFVVAVGALTTGPLPILPLQILFLNLVTDVFPALALGACEGAPELMQRRPRDPDSSILSRRDWRGIFAMGGVMAASTLGALWIASARGASDAEATTIAFLSLAMAQLWHVVSMRDPDADALRNEVTRNPWVWAALALCVALLVAATSVPLLADVLSLERPGLGGWGLAFAASLVPLVVGQVDLARRARRHASR